MKRFYRSLRHALHGWQLFFKTEQNGQLQSVAAMLAVAAGFILKISVIEWLFILLCIALVLCLEMTNSAIEKLVDHLHPARHDQVRWVKDVAAGAVLFGAVISLIIGCIIFFPKIYSLIKYGTAT